MKILCLVFLLFAGSLNAQSQAKGVISGSVIDEFNKPLQGASVELISPDSTTHTLTTDKEGHFLFTQVPLGYQRLKLSFVSKSILILDSIHIREDRYEFNLNELVLKNNAASNMDEIVIYAEKPLVQSKDGNITFNASESPLSAGSNASDLLNTVPLISKDASGKLLVRGKEPKILIDDKPVELNLQQLQDLLESMPGSAIEKIEVLTNPPPQYANESSVINIVTKKGRVGKSGRLSVYAGTTAEKGAYGNYNYRKKGIALSIYAGVGQTQFQGSGYSIRENRYTDSVNHFTTNNNYNNKALRPNLRANIDYDINKYQSINFVFQYNQSHAPNNGMTEYKNVNRFDEVYKISKRNLQSLNDNFNPNISLNYTFNTKKAGEVLRVFSNFNFSASENDRNLLLQYFTPDFEFLSDSVQVQTTNNRTHGYHLRMAYNVPLADKKTYFSAGTYFSNSNSRIIVDAAYKRKADDAMITADALSNDFYFHQYITNARASLKHMFAPGFSISSGLATELTKVQFELFKTDSTATNNYWSLLPFFNLNKTWEEVLNLSLSYRRNIRRPGINEQNPSIDYTDPYNIRFGNPDLAPSMVNSFDLILGKTHKNFYANMGLGFNTVKNIFSQIRTPVSDSRTEITWQNISDRKEYEISTWSGYTFRKKLRMNFSASYTYNEYVNIVENSPTSFKNGVSLTSNFNANYIWKELYSVTGNITYNRFANPQGTVRSNVSMNIGAQAKLFQKKITVSLNLVDPFNQQEYRTFTYGKTFSQENYGMTKTRNLRLTIGYNFLENAAKTNKAKEQLKNLMKK